MYWISQLVRFVDINDFASQMHVVGYLILANDLLDSCASVFGWQCDCLGGAIGSKDGHCDGFALADMIERQAG